MTLVNHLTTLICILTHNYVEGIMIKSYTYYLLAGTAKTFFDISLVLEIIKLLNKKCSDSTVKSCVNLFAFFCLYNVLCRSELCKLDCLLFSNVSISFNLPCVKLNLQVLFTLIESPCCINTLFNILLLASTKLFIIHNVLRFVFWKTSHQLFPQCVGLFIQYFNSISLRLMLLYPEADINYKVKKKSK